MDISRWLTEHPDCTMKHSDMMAIFGGMDRHSSQYYLHDYRATPSFGSQRFSLNLVDIPGSADDQGRDDSNFLKLAKFLSQCGSVSTFIFVVMRNHVFDYNFKRLFNYYWDWLGDLGVHFVVMHTDWDPFERGFEEKTIARKDAFSRAFPQVTGVQHIFVDSVWEEPGDGSYEYWDPCNRSQQKKAFAIQSVNKLITEFLLRDCISLNRLQFRKTPNMVALDLALSHEARACIQTLNATLQNTQQTHASAIKALTEIAERVRDAEAQVRPNQERLQAIDLDDRIELARVDAFIWHLWGWETVTLTTNTRIHEIRTTNATTTVTWDQISGEGTFSATGKADSGYKPSLYLGSLIAYGTSREVHQVEIIKLHDLVRPAMSDLNAARTIQDQENKRAEGLGEDLARLKEQLQGHSLVLRFCSWISLPINEFIEFSEFYMQHHDGIPRQDSCQQIVHLLCGREARVDALADGSFRET